MNRDQQSLSLLVVGTSQTGKTHYGGQLLKRLNEGSGKLKMDGVAENIAPFEEVLVCLAQGRSAGHTPSGTYQESLWPILVQGERESTPANLIWPDYAGEQVARMTTDRQVTPSWQERIRQSDGWLLFVRLETVRAYEDVLARPRGHEAMKREGAGQEAPSGTTGGDTEQSHWSGQAEVVELLQLLLFVRRVGTLRRVRKPSLVVVLSCWDEIDLSEDEVRPDRILRQRLPLVASFIEANWDPNFVSVLGLSALGKRLDPEAADDAYLDHGPETQGWVVLPSGRRDADLTIPVATLVGMVAQDGP